MFLDRPFFSFLLFLFVAPDHPDANTPGGPPSDPVRPARQFKVHACMCACHFAMAMHASPECEVIATRHRESAPHERTLF